MTNYTFLQGKTSVFLGLGIAGDDGKNWLGYLLSAYILLLDLGVLYLVF